MSPLTTFLSGSTPTRLRGLQWLALSDIGSVGTKTATSDDGGGVTTAWGFGPDVPCRVDPVLARGADEGIVAGRLSDRSTHIITVPAGTPATHDNRFSVVGRGTFEITAVRSRTDEWVRVLEAVPAS